MTLLSPLGALAGLLALAPVCVALVGARRLAAVRSALGLAPAPRRTGAVPVAAAAAALALLGLAAAQPALIRETRPNVRSTVQTLFVLDTSRSMAASRTASSPTRLDRAAQAAIELRAAIPDVASGIATMTDRVLPDLLPVTDAAGFDAVARRTVQIDSPPPASSSARATTFAALDDVPAGSYFAPETTRRVVVLLTDGESNPYDSSRLADAFGADRPYRFVGVRFWSGDESVYDSDGAPERAYRPDPGAPAAVDTLASSLGGRDFPAGDLPAASRYLQSLTSVGPTAKGSVASRTTYELAPFIAGLALLLVLYLALAGRFGSRSVGSGVS
jgi:hypothetical protein